MSTEHLRSCFCFWQLPCIDHPGDTDDMMFGEGIKLEPSPEIEPDLSSDALLNLDLSSDLVLNLELDQFADLLLQPVDLPLDPSLKPEPELSSDLSPKPEPDLSSDPLPTPELNWLFPVFFDQPLPPDTHIPQYLIDQAQAYEDWLLEIRYDLYPVLLPKLDPSVCLPPDYFLNPNPSLMDPAFRSAPPAEEPTPWPYPLGVPCHEPNLGPPQPPPPAGADATTSLTDGTPTAPAGPPGWGGGAPDPPFASAIADAVLAAGTRDDLVSRLRAVCAEPWAQTAAWQPGAGVRVAVDVLWIMVREIQIGSRVGARTAAAVAESVAAVDAVDDWWTPVRAKLVALGALADVFPWVPLQLGICELGIRTGKFWYCVAWMRWADGVVGSWASCWIGQHQYLDTKGMLFKFVQKMGDKTALDPTLQCFF
jgi:hypothetical protein